MSYSCEISFKQISGDDVYEFFQNFKRRTVEHIPEIASTHVVFSPLYNAHPWEGEFEPTRELREATITWAKESVFRYRYFYNRDLHLLGVYSVEDSQKELFDCTVHFQNSTDQNYPFEDWNGVKYFGDVADKWKNATDEEVKAWYKKEYDEEYNPKWSSDLNYYRQTAAYSEIWGNFEATLENDDSVVYLSLFGFFDFEHMSHFYVCIKESVEKTIEEWKKKFGKKKEN